MHAQHVVETFLTHGSHPALRNGMCRWCPDGRADDRHVVSREHLVKGRRKRGITIRDQDVDRYLSCLRIPSGLFFHATCWYGVRVRRGCCASVGSGFGVVARAPVVARCTAALFATFRRWGQAFEVDQPLDQISIGQLHVGPFPSFLATQDWLPLQTSTCRSSGEQIVITFPASSPHRAGSMWERQRCIFCRVSAATGSSPKEHIASSE
jgi:hypothetical protein